MTVRTALSTTKRTVLEIKKAIKKAIQNDSIIEELLSSFLKPFIPKLHSTPIDPTKAAKAKLQKNNTRNTNRSAMIVVHPRVWNNVMTFLPASM
mmetsp:Transcript_38511/g.43962  ORF Transcript_38511/g.43962 Transcript_38511/m.43962 type:complete len:94 (+) Transcript_38511:118-399(+)|eukprot:CAMPEP_0194196758 /NCGR_PEP_ID=MMETSP0154-20130528/76839_1 /TAXON_ID=1049557 /ORGANISM="Thalassiothrix antarctica, Strain L6-D1" /LENGTH=93 /DNA_ID=CAMNT_0038921381 /DNA_START=154 /DNA_END=435 /DNA_ORIENTATION=+